MTFLTNLIFEPKGRHDVSSAYKIKDTVMSEDGSQVYFALQDVPAGISLDNEDYWKLQIDLHSTKTMLEDALASFGNYAKSIGTRVKGETAKVNGNPVSFLPDAGSLLQPVTVLEPQQQGSGEPYPAGGGRNKLVNTATTQTVNGVTFTVYADGSITISGTATADAYLQIDNATILPAGSYLLSGGTENVGIRVGKGADNTFVGYHSGGNPFPFEFGEDTLIRISIRVLSGVALANETIYPMLRLASDTDATYAPPSNIRPISGWDSVNLNAAGKNLLPDFVSAGTVNGVTVTKNADGSCRINGTAAGAVLVSLANANNKVDILTGRYTVSLGTALPNGVTARAEAYNKTTLKWFKTYGNIPAANGEYTINIDGAYYTALLISIPSGAVVDLTIYPMIRLASITDATYEPYQGKLHTVQIGETVYGGKLDWTTGKLVAEWGVYALTGEGSARLTSASVYNAKCFMSDVVPNMVGNSNTLNGAKSSHFAEDVWNVIAGMDSPFGKFAITTSNKIGIAYDGTIDEANAWLAAQNAAGTPVQFAWKLANPIEIQLTTTIISAADPEQTNTLYGDGRIDVEYVKPLHVSIEERIAAAMQTN